MGKVSAFRTDAGAARPGGLEEPGDSRFQRDDSAWQTSGNTLFVRNRQQTPMRKDKVLQNPHTWVQIPPSPPEQGASLEGV